MGFVKDTFKGYLQKSLQNSSSLLQIVQQLRRLGHEPGDQRQLPGCAGVQGNPVNMGPLYGGLCMPAYLEVYVIAFAFHM